MFIWWSEPSPTLWMAFDDRSSRWSPQSFGYGASGWSSLDCCISRLGQDLVSTNIIVGTSHQSIQKWVFHLFLLPTQILDLLYSLKNPHCSNLWSHISGCVCVWGGAPVKPISRTLKCVHMFKKCSTASIICVISFGQLQRSLLDPWHTSDLMDWTKPISDLLVFLSKFGYPKWLFQTLPTPLENLIYSIAEVFPKVGHPSTHTPSLNFYWNLSLLGFLNTCFIKFHLVYFNF